MTDRTRQRAAQKLLQVAAGEPGDLHVLDEARPVELGDLHAQRVTGCQFGRAVAADQQQPFVRSRPGQIREKVQCRRVGPLQVLHHENHRPVRAEVIEHPQNRTEDPRLATRSTRRHRVLVGVVLDVGVDEARHKIGQFPVAGPGKLQHLRRADTAGQPTQRVDQRCVRKFPGAERDA
jgi:hypothetical protein